HRVAAEVDDEEGLAVWCDRHRAWARANRDVGGIVSGCDPRFALWTRVPSAYTALRVRRALWTCECGLGMDSEHLGWSRVVVEGEVGGQVAEDLLVLAHVGSGVGPPVCRRVEALAVEEVVFDELVVGVEAQGLVVDVTLLGVGADDDAGDAKPVAVGVHGRWNDVVIEATPVVPGEKDRG